VKELGEAAGGGLAAGMVARVRKVFGSDARSVAALEQARRDGGRAAVAELAVALAWYARRDEAFARELAGWAAQVGAGDVKQRVEAGRTPTPRAGIRPWSITGPVSEPGGVRWLAGRRTPVTGCGRISMLPATLMSPGGK
jgi:hypothetical protein